MTKKIFKSILSVAIVILCASLFVVTGVLYGYFSNLQQSQLRDELSLAAIATEQLGEDYLNYVDSNRYRLTWVDTNGTVLFDSHADASSMENHSQREEIAEALKTGTGSSTRQSSTLTEKTIYEAVRLENGTILRISVSRATAIMLVVGMIQPTAIILLLAIVLSAFLAHRMAKKIVEPMNSLDLDHPMENDAYEELSPLLHRIHAQHQKIAFQVQTLKRRQEEFEQVTGNMKEGLVLLDSTGRIISLNPSAKVLYEVDSQCVGNDFLTVERRADMQHAIKKALESGHSYFQAEKNGRDYQFDISRIDSDEHIYGIVILSFDITEQVKAEQHRREFTANVSHELKTPLQSIIGSAELLENQIVKEEDFPRFVGHIRKEATRLVSLIDDIIRLSQLDEGTQMQHEDVLLSLLVEEVFDTLSEVAADKDISLETECCDAVLHGVPSLLYEILYNLCDNAIKYSHHEGTVKVCVTQEQNIVKIQVLDNGIGIAPEHQDKIFERFYRVDKSHSKESGGTGLGLSIVKHAVLHHNGNISLKSTPGNGTTITIEFDTSK